MREYFKRAAQSATAIWITLTIDILVTSTLYLSLRSAGVPENINLIITLFTLAGLIILGLLIFPVPLLKLREDKFAKSELSDALEGNELREKIALDNQQMAWLQNYFDRISELLLHEHLNDVEPNIEARRIAQARTLTTLTLLDAKYKRILIDFLYTIRLINQDANAIHFYKADLREVDFSHAHLSHAHLREADFSKANLSGANLSHADLREANLSGADLSGADLSGADLSHAHLSGANLREANLREANLREADLREANFSGADLKGVTGLTKEMLNSLIAKGAIFED